MHQFKSEVHIIAKVVNLSKKQGIFEKNYTVKIEVQQNSYLAHDFERSEKE